MNVRQLYHELIVTSIVLNVFDALLSGFAVFCAAYFILTFYRIAFYIALLPALFFFARSLFYKLTQNKIIVLEKRYPDLREKLRTSFDYQEKTNTVINELHSEIVSVIRQCDISAYLNLGKLSVKILIIISMLSSTLYLASMGFDILAVKYAVTGSGFYKKATAIFKEVFPEQGGGERLTLDKGRLITLGNKELNISIETFDTELDTNDISNSEKNDFGGHYPPEIIGAAQETYQEKIPEEYKDAVKEYFKKINE